MINDPVYPPYDRTYSMRTAYLPAFADFCNSQVGYLNGLSSCHKGKYPDATEQLGLCDRAIDELIQCKENSSNEMRQQLYVSRDMAILNDFLTSTELKHVMEKLTMSFSYQLSWDSISAQYGKKALKR